MPEQQKIITILGVTGNQGSSVAHTFLSLPSWTVRGMTRSPTSPQALSLAAKGVQLFVADIDDPASLIPAFTGAHVIFAMTDFWGPFFSYYAEGQKISKRATGEYAMEVEIKRGKGIVDSVAQVLKAGGVLERFVFSTLPSFKEVSGGKYDFNYHFDGKAVVSNYLKEIGGGLLWERSSLLNMGFYMDNLVKLGFMAGKKEDGKYLMKKTGRNDAVHPFVFLGDTGKFVDLLVRAPPTQDLLGVSEMSTYVEYMKIWSEVTGVPSQVREMTIEEADEATPGGLGIEAAQSNTTSAEFGWGKDLVMPKDLDPSVKLTSLRSYIENEDWETFLANIQ